MLTMSEQLHGNHTKAVNHIRTTTHANVDFGDWDDVANLKSSMHPLLTFNLLFTQSIPLGIPHDLSGQKLTSNPFLKL